MYSLSELDPKKELLEQNTRYQLKLGSIFKLKSVEDDLFIFEYKEDKFMTHELKIIPVKKFINHKMTLEELSSLENTFFEIKQKAMFLDYFKRWKVNFHHHEMIGNGVAKCFVTDLEGRASFAYFSLKEFLIDECLDND